MKNTRHMLAAATAAGAPPLTAAPTVTAAPTPQPVTTATTASAAEDFSLTAPSHTEAAGNLLDKQITFGSYWAGGNLPGGTQATLTAGAAEGTLLNGETYTAPVVAGGTNSGLFPSGGAALAPSFRLDDSSRNSANGATNDQHVTSISYPVTVVGNFGSCTYTVEGTANSKFNVTSLELRDQT